MPLFIAAQEGQADVTTDLLAAGSAVDVALPACARFGPGP